jgi:hypothetical protein
MNTTVCAISITVMKIVHSWSHPTVSATAPARRGREGGGVCERKRKK